MADQRRSLDRRLFIGSLGSAFALAACGPAATALGPLRPAASGRRRRDSSSTMTLTVTNKTGTYSNDEIYFYNVGTDPSGVFYHQLPDGSLEQCQLSDNDWMCTPSGICYADYAIPLAAKGETTISYPQLSGRIYFSIGQKLLFRVVALSPSGIGLQEPSGWDPSDPNYNTLFDWVEYTFDSGGWNGNTTMVDQFGIPLVIHLTGSAGSQNAGELVDNGRSEIFSKMTKQSAFAPLIVKNGGTDLRVIAPGHGIENAIFPADYLEDPINNVWSTFATKTLSVTTDFGTAQGQVRNGVFTFTRSGQTVATFDKPTTIDVFECDGTLAAPNNEQGAIAAVLGAALNRSTLPKYTSQPFCTKSKFYQPSKTNHYAQILHAQTKNYNCYAFAFDDQCGYSSDLSDPAPTELNITLGPF
jgi:hypothetical protein